MEAVRRKPTDSASATASGTQCAPAIRSHSSVPQPSPPSSDAASATGWNSPIGSAFPTSPAYTQHVHPALVPLQPQTGYGIPAQQQAPVLMQPQLQAQAQAQAIAAVPRPLPSIAYPLAPTSLTLTGVKVPQQLHTAVCSALRSSGVDFDYSPVKYKAHCFSYDHAGQNGHGPVYFIVRVFALPAAGGDGGGDNSGPGFTVEFQRQWGDPLALLQAYDACEKSLALSAVGSKVSRKDGEAGGPGGPHRDNSFQSMLIAEDNAAYAAEKSAAIDKAAAEASVSPGAARMKALLSLDGIPDTVAPYTAMAADGTIAEERLSEGLWTLVSMCRSDRFTDNVGTAVQGSPPSPASKACQALMQALLGRACAPLYQGYNPSATIGSRSAAVSALCGLLRCNSTAAWLGGRAVGQPVTPNITLVTHLLAVAEALPIQADCMYARRELVHAACLLAGAVPELKTVLVGGGNGGMLGGMADCHVRLQRLKGVATAAGDKRMLDLLATLS